MKWSMCLVSSEEVSFFVQVMVGKPAFNWDGAPYNAMYFLSVLAAHILLWSKLNSEHFVAPSILKIDNIWY